MDTVSRSAGGEAIRWALYALTFFFFWALQWPFETERRMVRTLKIAGLAALLIFAVGCAFEVPIAVPGVRVSTNFPYNRYQVSVENNIPGTFMEVKLNGIVVKAGIPTGQNWVGGFWSFGASTQMSVVAVFTDPYGNWVGMTYPRQFYYDGYTQRADTWVVSRWDIQR